MSGAVRLIFRTIPPRFTKLQPLRSRPGPDLFATLKSVFFLANTSTESGIRRDYAVQTVFHDASEHHFSVFDTSQLWGGGRAFMIPMRWLETRRRVVPYEQRNPATLLNSWPSTVFIMSIFQRLHEYSGRTPLRHFEKIVF